MEKEKTHWFQFLLDSKTLISLIEAMKDDKERVQRFIVEIIKKFYWYIEELHFTGPDQKCQHKKISEDMEDERVRLWLPLPEGVYQRLKQVHKDLDTFSIGQIVREILHKYLGMRKGKSFDEVMLELDARQMKWLETRAKLRVNIQLHSHLLGVTSGKSSHMKDIPAISQAKMARYLVIYDESAKAVVKLVI